MDSLSQIVLGAAVGEAVLGRHMGNRAMVWGAVAGTLPDMDVLGQYFLNELDNLAFHRGISHSILASVLGAVVLVVPLFSVPLSLEFPEEFPEVLLVWFAHHAARSG